MFFEQIPRKQGKYQQILNQMEWCIGSKFPEIVCPSWHEAKKFAAYINATSKRLKAHAEERRTAGGNIPPCIEYESGDIVCTASSSLKLESVYMVMVEEKDT